MIKSYYPLATNKRNTAGSLRVGLAHLSQFTPVSD